MSGNVAALHPRQLNTAKSHLKTANTTGTGSAGKSGVARKMEGARVAVVGGKSRINRTATIGRSGIEKTASIHPQG